MRNLFEILNQQVMLKKKLFTQGYFFNIPLTALYVWEIFINYIFLFFPVIATYDKSFRIFLM